MASPVLSRWPSRLSARRPPLLRTRRLGSRRRASDPRLSRPGRVQETLEGRHTSGSRDRLAARGASPGRGRLGGRGPGLPRRGAGHCWPASPWRVPRARDASTRRGRDGLYCANGVGVEINRPISPQKEALAATAAAPAPLQSLAPVRLRPLRCFFWYLRWRRRGAAAGVGQRALIRECDATVSARGPPESQRACGNPMGRLR